MAKPTVRIGFEPTVGVDAIGEAVRGVIGVVGGRTGCTTCGLGGFDVALEAIDSDDFEQLTGERIDAVAEIEGVHGAVSIDG